MSSSWTNLSIHTSISSLVRSSRETTRKPSCCRKWASSCTSMTGAIKAGWLVYLRFPISRATLSVAESKVNRSECIYSLHGLFALLAQGYQLRMRPVYKTVPVSTAGGSGSFCTRRYNKEAQSMDVYYQRKAQMLQSQVRTWLVLNIHYFVLLLILIVTALLKTQFLNLFFLYQVYISCSWVLFTLLFYCY